MGWLIGQTKAVAPDYPQSGGFPDIVNEPQQYNCTDRATVWSRDPAPTPSGSPQLYYVFDFKNGAIEATAGSNWLWLRRAVDGKKQEQYYWYQ